ncbi:hypothetical protein UA3_00316 [Enterococcus faecium EnGen0263]|uniref:hypothetical protein n=1 Tax=Enterococcus TaxID=1350 RepID=UPI00032E0986|nr:hypothetical protein [Enterococcus faecium]EGP5632706.1 Two component regulator three Y domain-containing protein [Enterococcus faecium]EOH57826.1 hypothetical protein UA3_00316 [Enterococcus faecium EnGen0263]MBS6012497.1 hypothetical protein [Enterococcus faecium]PQC78622.1 Two component regulator three Y domain-containing protein [Enterococcus faecium]
MKSLLLKLYYKIFSRTYKNGKINLNFIYKRKWKNNHTIIIVFSAFPRTGFQATYNYTKTLKSVSADQLFILDSFGYQKRGVFYLAEDKNFEVEKSVDKLINKILRHAKYKKIIFVGSSKGGYAATYFGIKHCATDLIIGGNMYYLGNYLTDSPVKEPILYAMMGETNTSDILKLNGLLKDKIINSNYLPNVYIHYSKNDHMYNEHIKYFLEDYKESNGVIQVIDEANYVKHQDIKYYFPTFLLNSLTNILKQG